MNWTITVKNKAAKQIKKLPKSAQAILLLLIRDLERSGPIPSPGWKNYSKFKGVIGDKHHCHFINGKPTYVCCWEVIDKQLKIMEVYYAGTHEKAPY